MECDLGLIFKIADDTGAEFVGGNYEVDFLYLNSREPAVELDVQKEIVSGDAFFGKAKECVTGDRETLLYRQEFFRDVLQINELPEFLSALHAKLNEISPLMQGGQGAAGREEKLRDLLYPVVYIELVELICRYLEPIADRLTARSLLALYNMADNEKRSAEYGRIGKYYMKNSARLRSVHSVTVGINLTPMFEPKEAGIVALNSEEFSSGDFWDRVIRMDFAKDDFHCIAPLTVIDKKLGYQDSQRMNNALLKGLDSVLGDGLRHCSRSIEKYLKDALKKFYEWSGSLGFVTEAVKRITELKEKRIPLAFPTVSDRFLFDVDSLYDDSLCRKKDKKDIVPNTVRLEPDVCCYILTGPNSGGKSVFLNSLAAAQYYFQLGMPIPARAASLPICDTVFKISVEEQANADQVGRFERECITLSGVLKKFTPRSLALIDEAFTSTSAEEAVPIAANFIREICRIGGKCLFVTHYHELDGSQPSVRQCGGAVDYLHTESDGERRTYTVLPGSSDPRSDAHNIAKKYGLL